MESQFTAIPTQATSDDSTRVSLSVGGCSNTQAELDHLAGKIQQEAMTAQRPTMRLEQMVKLLQAEKAEFVHALLDLLTSAQIDLSQPIHFHMKNGQLAVAEQPKPHYQAHQIDYLFAQCTKLADDFAHLEEHTRAVEMGRIATAAYGDWKQNQDPTSIKGITRTAMFQLQNMSGATLQQNKLRLVLEGQAQRQLSFNRKFSFA